MVVPALQVDTHPSQEAIMTAVQEYTRDRESTMTGTVQEEFMIKGATTLAGAACHLIQISADFMERPPYTSKAV